MRYFELLRVFLSGASFVMVMMLMLWAYSVVKKDASYVDRVWGLGFVAFALGCSFVTKVPSLVALLVVIWGLRLSLYLTWRNWGHGEDFRYVAMRKTHGKNFWWVSFFTVFLFQGALVCVVGAPIFFASLSFWPSYFWPIGTLVFFVGLFFEVVGDFQLTRFKKDAANKGKVMNQGLWRYTRHPNYFGNALLWWGIYIVACGSYLGVYSFFGPLLMTFLLLKVSGVAMLEKDIAERRPGYAEYIRNTNAFVPWFSKRR